MICSSVKRLFFTCVLSVTLRENSSFQWLSFPGAGHEETQFRGYLLQQIVSLTQNTGAAIVIQAVIFVFIHGSGQGMSGYLTRFAFGVAFGLVAVFRKSLWPSITAHALINLMAFLAGLY